MGRCEEPYQAMKQMTLAASSRLPKPPNTQPTTLRRSPAWRGRDPVGAELSRTALCLHSLEAGLRRYGQASKRLIDGHIMPIEFGQV